MKKVKEKEKDVQRAALDWLTAKRIFHYRNNTGGFFDANKRFYRFGEIGSPDIIAVVKGRYVGIECKGTDGKVSENQAEFGRRLIAAGGTYIVIRSLDDLIAAFEELYTGVAKPV